MAEPRKSVEGAKLALNVEWEETKSESFNRTALVQPSNIDCSKRTCGDDFARIAEPVPEEAVKVDEIEVSEAATM
jgi:hypothetical protein